MPILTTCHSNRDYDRILTADAYRGVLPAYQELRSGTDPTMAFIDAVRTALSLHYKAQLGTLSRLFSPTAAAWSAREIGATYVLRFETLDPGFSVEWRVEIVDEQTYTATVGANGVEVFEADRSDQPIAYVANPTHAGVDADARLRGLGFRRVGSWTVDGDTATTIALIDPAQQF